MEEEGLDNTQPMEDRQHAAHGLNRLMAHEDSNIGPAELQPQGGTMADPGESQMQMRPQDTAQQRGTEGE